MLKIEVTRCENPDCRKPIDPERASHGAKTCDPRCRAAAFRARHGYVRVSDGGPRPVGLERRSHASRSGPSGRQVSFRKAVRAVADLLAAEAGWDATVAYETAESWMAGALPEKQRARR